MAKVTSGQKVRHKTKYTRGINTCVLYNQNFEKYIMIKWSAKSPDFNPAEILLRADDKILELQ
jgi:hypothetical protein